MLPHLFVGMTEAAPHRLLARSQGCSTEAAAAAAAAAPVAAAAAAAATAALAAAASSSRKCRYQHQRVVQPQLPS